MAETEQTEVRLGLKAVVHDLETMEALIFSFTESIGHVAVQEDVYFNVPRGQLKLRTTTPNKKIGELISSKSLQTHPHMLETRTSPIHDPAKFRDTLNLCMSELGSIRKKRRVYVKDNVRINLDEVENLGPYIDIEIRDNGSNDVNEIAKVVRAALAIKEEALVSLSYLELYRTRKSADSGFDDETSDASL